jgi:hypothetical protein
MAAAGTIGAVGKAKAIAALARSAPSLTIRTHAPT